MRFARIIDMLEAGVQEGNYGESVEPCIFGGSWGAWELFEIDS